ncbi:hypothetical protein [Streptomyces sp. NPDC090445]|uniref:hypothetical protein n=1 Tax=Streptomyces sp. NPDC090445 TaxID=3365963 RepID=UPI003812943A
MSGGGHQAPALEDLPESEREEAARALRDLLDAHTRAGGAPEVTAPGGGQAVGGNVDVRADHGSAAALRMGDVTVGTPPAPGPQQG